MVVTAGILRPARRGRLRERRAPARADLRAGSAPSPASQRPRRSCTSSCASRPTRGACAEPPADSERLSLWHETAGDDWTPRPPCRATSSVDVAIVGGGLHRTVDRLLPGRGRPVAPDRRARGRARRASAPPGATAAGARPCSPPRSRPWRRCPGSAGRGALAQHAAMRGTVDEVGRVVRRRGHRRAPTPRAARSRWPAAAAQLAAGPRGGRRGPVLGPGRGRRAAARRGRGASASCDATGTLGATYTPDCAAHPPGAARPRLAARRASGAASRIFERTRVHAVEPGPACARRRGDGARAARDPGDRGLHRHPAAASAARWSRSTR